LSRKQQDEIEAEAKKAGALGLLRLKLVNGALEGPAAKFLADGAAARLGLREGELALLVAGPDRISSPALDRVRQDVARRMNMVPGGELRFLWVTDFPLFEHDASTGALGAVHHPFTAPHPDDVSMLASTPETARAQA
jgi:Aspartyl-tRNA synthetase